MHHYPQSEINDPFHCKRNHSGEIVHVYNSAKYLMADYDVKAGRTSWQRVAAVTQRESVQKWLRKNYPVLDTPKAVAISKLKARAARQ